jgi:CRISPR-associated endonuclease Csn1
MASSYILGLDLGPNSVGWALLEAQLVDGEHQPVGLLDTADAGHPALGARVFEAGLQNFDTAKEASLCEQRRKARAMRRTLQRRAARKRCVRELLVLHGLLPSETAEFERVMTLNPYQLRAAALDRELGPHELGRALYHLAQRRGFKSNRRQAEKQSEKQKLNQEMDQLLLAREQSGARSLGEYLDLERRRGLERPDDNRFDRTHLGEVRLRNREFRRDSFVAQPRRARRDFVKEEYDLIVREQRRRTAFRRLDDDFFARLEHFIFHQGTFELTPERVAKAPPRANLHRAPKLKNCPLETEEKRCSKNAWAAQRFRILKDVNNLRFAVRGSPERPLDETERAKAIELLSEQKEVKFDRLRKALGLATDGIFNLERGRKEALEGNSLDKLLAGAMGKVSWRSLPEPDRAALRDAVELEEDEARLRAELKRFGVPSKGVDEILGWTLQDGYVAYSEKALRKLLPHLERGANEYEAIRREYSDRGEGLVWDELPSLVAPNMPVELADLSNPIVRRGLVELRKVVNAIVREHGKPVHIVVELAREMRQSSKQRDEYNKQLQQRKKERDGAKRWLEERGEVINDSNIRRVLMWRQQGGFCLYSVPPRIIDQDHVLSAAVEEDHIQPRSQTFDDSRPNIALCFATANQAKGNRTVAKWLGEDSDAYRQVLSNAEKYVQHEGLPAGVVERLRQVHVDASDFLDRQLNDTKYMSRLACLYLNLLYPPSQRVGQRAVRATRGGLTAELRRSWGLNNVLDYLCDSNGVLMTDGDKDAARKSRADHRHHAIDAVVIACSTRAMLMRYQTHLERATPGFARGAVSGFAPPWPRLREDVMAAARRVVVSHRPQLKISGPLHEATYYGAVRDSSGNTVPGRFVTRKRLDQLTAEMVRGGQIVDDVVRRLVDERLASLGWSSDPKGKVDLPKDWWRTELRDGNGTPIRRVRVHVNLGDAVQLGHRYAKAGNNHHFAFEPWAGEGSPLRVRIERMFEFAKHRSSTNGGSAADSARFPVARTLGRKESVLVTSPGGSEPVVCVVETLSGAREAGTGLDLRVRDARDARPASTGNKVPFKRFNSTAALLDHQVRKVQVDPLGRISPAGD